MASAPYKKALKSLEDGNFDLLTDNIKAVLVNTGLYTVDLTNHQFLSDIAGGAQIALTSNLTGKSTTNGVFDADDTTFLNSDSGTSCAAVVLFQDTGVAGTSRLISYHDDYTGLPITTNGVNIDMIWDNGTNKIIKLG